MSTKAASTPLETLSGRIGARLCPSQIIFCEPPTLEMRAIPEFPGCRAGLEETDIVWDVFALLDSIRRPGAWSLLTCSCGDGTHADLHELVLVSCGKAGQPILHFSRCKGRGRRAQRCAAASFQVLAARLSMRAQLGSITLLKPDSSALSLRVVGT